MLVSLFKCGFAGREAEGRGKGGEGEGRGGEGRGRGKGEGERERGGETSRLQSKRQQTEPLSERYISIRQNGILEHPNGLQVSSISVPFHQLSRSRLGRRPCLPVLRVTCNTWAIFPWLLSLCLSLRLRLRLLRFPRSKIITLCHLPLSP